jgi:hypothetical protein
MQFQVAYLLLIVATLVPLGAAAVYGWRYRRAPGGAWFFLFCGSAWLWTLLVGAMAIASPSIARLLLSLKYLAIGMATTTNFLFVAQRTGWLRSLRRWQHALFFVIPLLGHVASFNDRAGMISAVSFGQSHSLTHVAAIAFGPIYWLFAGYSYALILCSIGCLLLARREQRSLASAQLLSLLLGVVAPAVTNVLLITGIAPRAFDPMPFGLAISAMCLWWGAFRGRILDLVPVARSVLIDSLQEGILIVDRERRILDLNACFARVAGVDSAALVGVTLEECTFPAAELREALRAAADVPPADGKQTALFGSLTISDRVFDLRSMVVGSRNGGAEARIFVLQDVTERQRWQDDQALLIAQLQEALGEVKTLTGLLPICAGCKKIRDDGGDWQHIEVYIRARTDAEFSHGMCPSCVEHWYPDLLDSAPLPK